MNRAMFVMSRPDKHGVRPVYLHGTRLIGHVMKPWGRKVQAWAYKPLGGVMDATMHRTARDAILAMSKEL